MLNLIVRGIVLIIAAYVIAIALLTAEELRYTKVQFEQLRANMFASCLMQTMDEGFCTQFIYGAMNNE